MADIFISYTRHYEPRVPRQLAEALTARGWEVRWDLHIMPRPKAASDSADTRH